VILTVTPNPALDLTWHVDGLTAGATHRVQAGATRAGGKGLNVARVLHTEGHDVVALATAGGPTGAEFTAELEASGIPHRLLPVSIPTRRTVAVVDDRSGATSILNEFGAALDPADSAAFLGAAARLGRDARAVAVSGSLPPGLDAEEIGDLVADLVRAGIPVVVDTNGPALLAAARAGAHALKPNREELEAATGRTGPLEGARALIDLGARLVVVSLGADGLVVVARTGVAIHARLPHALHGNATGAGDAAVAAIVVALASGADPSADTDAAAHARIDLARRTAAWSASAVLMPVAGELSPRHPELEAEVVVEPHVVEPRAAADPTTEERT
jgi:1-phosphofructokinase family hexose kinase